MRADCAVQRAPGGRDPVAAQTQLMREAGSRYIDFLVPGLLGMNIMGGSIWGMGFAIVDARRRKLMKRLVATPMPRHYFLLSFLISRLAMLVVEVGAFSASPCWCSAFRCAARSCSSRPCACSARSHSARSAC